MPELSASARAAGPWVAPDAGRVTTYPVDQLGGLCRACLAPIPAALPDDVHATCEPGWADLVAESKRAARRTTPPKERP